MPENIPVRESLACHDGPSYLAQADTMAPATAVKDYLAGGKLYVKSRTLQGVIRKDLPDFQFLPHDERSLAACYLQLLDPSGRPPLQGLKGFQVPDYDPVISKKLNSSFLYFS